METVYFDSVSIPIGYSNKIDVRFSVHKLYKFSNKKNNFLKLSKPFKFGIWDIGAMTNILESHCILVNFGVIFFRFS